MPALAWEHTRVRVGRCACDGRGAAQQLLLAPGSLLLWRNSTMPSRPPGPHTMHMCTHAARATPPTHTQRTSPATRPLTCTRNLSLQAARSPGTSFCACVQNTAGVVCCDSQQRLDTPTVLVSAHTHTPRVPAAVVQDASHTHLHDDLHIGGGLAVHDTLQQHHHRQQAQEQLSARARRATTSTSSSTVICADALPRPTTPCPAACSPSWGERRTSSASLF
jgi:hypothetical protein